MNRNQKNRSEVNTSELEKYIKEREMSKKYNLLFIFSFVIIGFSGLYYVVNARTFTSQPKEFIELEVNQTEQKQINAKPVFTSKSAANKSKRKPLRISGEQIVDKTILFTIDSFDKNATYKLTFGNGDYEFFNTKEFKYSYNIPGNYHVTLEAFYENDLVVVVCRDVIKIKNTRLANR